MKQKKVRFYLIYLIIFIQKDSLLGYKTSFTLSVIVVDQQETKEAVQFLKYYQELNANLPINSTYKTTQIPVPGPIVIGSIILQAGFASQAIQVKKNQIFLKIHFRVLHIMFIFMMILF